MLNLYHKYEELINYIIIGILTTCVSLFVYYGLTYTIFNPSKSVELQITNIISWISSVTFAYFTNRKFVFKPKNKMNLKEILSFYTSRISTLILDMLLMYILVTIFHFNDKIVKIIVQIVIIVLNYVLSKIFVFKEKK